MALALFLSILDPSLNFVEEKAVFWVSKYHVKNYISFILMAIKFCLHLENVECNNKLENYNVFIKTIRKTVRTSTGKL